MRMLRHIAVTAVILAAVLAGMIIFGVSAPPPPLASIGKPFTKGDFSDMPKIEAIPVRGVSPIAYSRWAPADPAAGTPVVIAIHGSSTSSVSMHLFGKALAADGIAVYAPDIRGHGATGQRGDIDYDGQLDDDLTALVEAVKARHPQAPLVLLGLSSGGGYALHASAAPIGKAFARTVLLAPMLGRNAPTVKPGMYDWASPSVPRIIGLRVLNTFGLRALNGLPVLSFAVMPEHVKMATIEYSYRLWRGFGTADYASDLRGAHSPLAVFVGEKDELFDASRFEPTVHAVRPDAAVMVLPGLSHIELITDPSAIPPIAAAIRSAGKAGA